MSLFMAQSNHIQFRESVNKPSQSGFKEVKAGFLSTDGLSGIRSWLKQHNAYAQKNI